MKYWKIVLWAALTLVASAASAQTEANRNRLAEIEKMEVKVKKGGPKFDRFGIRLVPEIGYGAHLVKSEDFRSQGLDSGQAYLQALDVFYRPFVWGSVHVGAAIGMDWFTIRDMLFIQDDDHNVLVAPFPEEDKEKDAKYRSSVREWTVMVPATLQFHFGKATVRLGAEALYSFSPKVRLVQDPELRLRFRGRGLFRALRRLRQVPARRRPAVPRSGTDDVHLDGGRLPDHLLIQVCGSYFPQIFFIFVSY